MKQQTLFKFSSIALALFATFGLIAEEDEQEQKKEKDKYVERMQVVGKKEALSKQGGSSTYIDETALEAFEYDDINRILANVPGVNIRQEDGYGLRPNIGFRGVTPERSKKINIMEDGILIGPAPYSAPAAYYFPMMSRMSAIEVFKGPAAIKYGPNTVAGTLNMLTRQIPNYDEGMIDVAIGSDNYLKTHAYIAKRNGNFGFLLEGLRNQVDGFKELDGGGDTGFDKNDLTLKVRYDIDSTELPQVIEVKLAYADEVSDETYLGLTDADFKANPYRRYAASQLAKMDWEHEQIQVNHFIDGDSFDITTRLYRNDFQRDWFKLNKLKVGFNTIRPQAILQDPETYRSEYQLITGERDSESAESLILGNNGREFYSQGIQSDLNWTLDFAGKQHLIEAGIRFHQDQIIRNHTEDEFAMVSGQLVHKGGETSTPTYNKEKADAWSLYLQDSVEFGDLLVSLGVRGEFIDSEYQNLKAGAEQDWNHKSYSIWLPGMSLFYTLSDTQGLFGGAHQGFVPSSPQQGVEVKAETSTAYELGYRYKAGQTHVEFVGFFSDFDNLKEACTFSSGSMCDVDSEFSGGAVDSYGLEATLATSYEVSDYEMPVSLVYTYTQAEFKTNFDSDFDQWGSVSVGDSVPYLPENQLTLNWSLLASQWRVNVLANYVDAMQEVAGSGATLSGAETDSLFTIDVSASYDLEHGGQVYAKIDNLLDEQGVISRRPYGARPNKPRQFYLGYKYYF